MEFGLQPFHVPRGDVEVRRIAVQASDGVAGQIATFDHDLDDHPVDEHVIGDFTQVHVSVDFEVQTVQHLAFEIQGFSTGPNGIARFEIFHHPDEFKGLQIQTAQFLQDDTHLVVFPAQDGSRTRRHHFHGRWSGSIDHDPFHGGRFVGEVHALSLQATHFPGHGQRTRRNGSLNRHRPNTVHGHRRVGLSSEEDVHLALKVRHRGRFAKDQSTGNFHRRQGSNPCAVAEERATGEVEIHRFFGDAHTRREAPPVFGERTVFFLARSVHHENGGLSPVFANIRRVPAKHQFDVEDHVFLKRPGQSIAAQHGA